MNLLNARRKDWMKNLAEMLNKSANNMHHKLNLYRIQLTINDKLTILQMI